MDIGNVRPFDWRTHERAHYAPATICTLARCLGGGALPSVQQRREVDRDTHFGTVLTGAQRFDLVQLTSQQRRRSRRVFSAFHLPIALKSSLRARGGRDDERRGNQLFPRRHDGFSDGQFLPRRISDVVYRCSGFSTSRSAPQARSATTVFSGSRTPALRAGATRGRPYLSHSQAHATWTSAR